MRNWLLSITFIFSVLFPADVNLSIDNFSDDGAGSVTFDIMMSNTEPVGGFQFNFLSGNGLYDGDDDCRCGPGDDALPEGCEECYYDYGVDRVRNNKEADTSTSGYSYGCEESGVCTDNITSSGDCEDIGVCSDDSFTLLSDCSDDGSCGDANYTTECECAWNGQVWTSANNVWIPENTYMPFDDIEDCFENINDDGEQLRWDYYNPDGNNDNYATLSEVEGFDQQRCHVPEYDSEYHEEESVAGQCSQFGSVCIATGGTETGPGTDYPIGTVLDWPLSCCNATQGGQAFNPFRDKDLCEGTVSINNNDYVVDSDWTWISYEDKATCESYAGFWYGSEDGTEGNEVYDVGEYFIDADASLAITSGSSGSSGAAGFFISTSASTVLAVNFTGATIPVSETPVSLATFSANYSDLSLDDVFELLSMSVCGTGSLGDWSGTNCPNDLIFSDSAGNELETEFSPSLWTFGTGISSIASDDDICSSIGGWGEDSEDDPTCIAYCGDGYCNNGEVFSTCSVDCESSCGDDVCSLFEGNDNGEVENPDSCPADCTVFGCGDFICSEGETNATCPYDCYNSFCGDGSCESANGENGNNCYEDCQPICGNNVCDDDDGEDFSNCQSDCISECGDGFYDHAGLDYDNDGVYGEEDSACKDYEIACGDGVYHYWGATFNGIVATVSNYESYQGCPSDYSETCGDGFYHHAGLDDAGSEDETCEDDYEPTPGDGYCDTLLEDPSNDGNDCISECGDGFYDHAGFGGSENQDCKDYFIVCNDGICDESEDYVSCLGDCPLPFCGDGNCNSPVEDFTNCSDDCISFCGDGIYDHAGIDYDSDGIFGVEGESCEDYFVICGDGIYDYWTLNDEGNPDNDTNDENDDGIPDCEQDYVLTCGDGYYDYLAGEFLECYNSETNELVDYVLTCGDAYCDYPLSENVEGSEDYCEDDCVIVGCIDSEACNWCTNCTADDDDGSCEYAQIGFDCEGEPILSTIMDIPITFSLSDNYPNPFNPVTSIEYSVEKAGHVNIAIYNVMGHEVFNLIRGYHSPGIRYSVAWNSNTQSNIPVSTGIYFYEMRSGDYIERKKMVLVK